jgi:pyridoxine 4-dehydrogenase
MDAAASRDVLKALAPYRDDLVIVTKVGARRGTDGSWLRASSPEELTQTVHDNLRSMLGVHGPAGGSLEAPLSVSVGEHQRLTLQWSRLRTQMVMRWS